MLPRWWLNGLGSFPRFQSAGPRSNLPYRVKMVRYTIPYTLGHGFDSYKTLCLISKNHTGSHDVLVGLGQTVELEKTLVISTV